MGATSSYYRYQITPAGGDMVRAEYNTVVISSNTPSPFPTTLVDTNTGGTTTRIAINVPAGIDQLVVSSSGGTHGTNGSASNNNGDGADMYVRFNATPTTSTYDCRSNAGANVETCTITNPAVGTWYVNFYANSSFRSVGVTAVLSTSNRCGGGGTNGTNDWVNCTSATPQYRDANNALVSRSLSAELTNYATWYSYHRTRIKAAKAGASEAFSRLAGSSMRVGYDSIWNRSPFDIPVGTNNGVFSGANRTTWFNRLHAADASDGTPLKGALQRAGEYFSNNASTGPWGPESGSNQLSCRQNFAILTTDGYWNDNSGYNSPVGDTDGTAGPTITGPNGLSYTYAKDKPYIDNFAGNVSKANTLADVAMHYWKRDLIASLTNNVPVSNNDPAFWQHMVTMGVSIGLQGNLNPQTDLVSITNGSKRWGDPTDAEDADRIDDLWHAAVNGRGNFVTAKNPTEFANAMVEALATVAARLGSASNVTANSTSFTSDSRVYQATYVSGRWSGDLSAYDATSAGLSPTPAWRAGSQIAYAGRKVFTWDGTAGATFPTAAQVSALTRTTGIAPVNGTLNAAYIKGDWSQERRMGGTLRNRDSLLGDIVNSSPNYSNDTKTLYVGANDGMLHAINAITGAEVFAFVPGNINFADLATFSDPQYTHKYFVDGPVVVSSFKQTPGQNILVGTLGRGGKGVYALDVTTPATFAANKVLWQMTDSGGDMGLAIGEPLIATLDDASHTKAVIVPNGINSTNGHSVLFVFNLATGALIKKIDTGVGGDNGLMDPRGADIDRNGTVDYIYAGDRKGNLWKFNFSGALVSDWVVAASGQPLYTSASGQPITTGVAIARNPLDAKNWVYFGTGSYLSLGDVGDATIQAMYAIQDNDVHLVEANLQERRIAGIAVINGRRYRALLPNSALPNTKQGWFLKWNNPTAGERVVGRPQMIGTSVVVPTIIPPSGVSCDAGGSGFITAIDAFTGTAPKAPFMDADGDGQFSGQYNPNTGIGSAPAVSGSPTSHDAVLVNLTVGDVMDPSGTGSTGGYNVGNQYVGVSSAEVVGGNPTVPIMVGDQLCFGKSNGDRECLKVNPGGGPARRVMWREILQD
jgi:type IV pilus assembly protein PilY1